MPLFNKVDNCKICGGSSFTSVIDLGDQSYTGIFVAPGEIVEKIPLELVSCDDCGLFQIGHDFDLDIMYGDSYGYRSGQNPWMVRHLTNAVSNMSKDLTKGDLVVEIGSNDATSLSLFPKNVRKIGVDPSAGPLKGLYPKEAELVVDFFSEQIVNQILERQGRAKIIMSFAMFYDLPNPIEFSKNVGKLLHEDGVWVFEQSYLISMLKAGAFDTVCHEHLEYYRLSDIERILSYSGLKVVDVLLNEANGGSFRIVATHNENASIPVSDNVQNFREEERKQFGNTLLEEFIEKTSNCRNHVLNLVNQCKSSGKNLYGIGASTKGNVLLQYCGLTPEDMIAVGEINPDKIGKVCPGTNIPIVSEDKVLSDKNGVYLILPWHFRDFFRNSDKFKGKRLFFPLPSWEAL